MILSCNSCEKKFVVPDNAISSSGRVVQCSSCGNKWKQFPIKQEDVKKSPVKPISIKKNEVTQIKSIPKGIKKIKRKKVQKRAGPNLYSPEYLTKKYGININENKQIETKKTKFKNDTNFGFYNYLILITIIFIFIFRILYFTQDIVVEQLPITEIYIDYLFESFTNIKEILLNFFFSY